MIYWEAATASTPANKLKSYWLFIYFTGEWGKLRTLFLIYTYTNHKPLYHQKWLFIYIYATDNF